MSRIYSVITCDAAGAASVSLPKVQGEILGIELEIGTLGTPTVTVEDSTTGEDFLTGITPTTDKAYRPRAAAHTVAGVAIAYAAGPPVVDAVVRPVICYGGLTVTVADGADHGRGSITIFTA